MYVVIARGQTPVEQYPVVIQALIYEWDRDHMQWEYIIYGDDVKRMEDAARLLEVDRLVRYPIEGDRYYIVSYREKIRELVEGMIG